MTFSRQSMLEPAASTSAFMLSITMRDLSLEGHIGEGRDRLLVGAAALQLPERIPHRTAAGRKCRSCCRA